MMSSLNSDCGAPRTANLTQGAPPYFSETHRAEDLILQLKEQLALREAQLEESEHRIKNHLQILGSLARRDGADPGLDGPQVAKNLTHRICAIAAAHSLYERHDDCGQAPALELLERVCRPYMGGSVQLRIDCDPDLEISQDQAASVAMIVNEAVCNAVKHAFPTSSGVIRIELRVSGEGYRLEIGDDGRGFRVMAPAKGKGMSLIEAFARQLRGALTLQDARGGGAVLRVDFPRHPDA